MSWDSLASDQHGVIARRQLMAIGVGRHEVDGLVRRGALTVEVPGVYSVRGAARTTARRLWVAVLATGGAIAFATAAGLWRVDDQQLGPLHVVIDPSRRVVPPPGVRVHRVFTPASALARLDGWPITNRTWTLLDHLGQLTRPDAMRLADRALQRNWIRLRDIEARLAEFPGRAGNTRLRELAGRLGDGAAAESERRLHRILRSHDITGWSPNYQVRAGGQLLAVIDVAFPAAWLAIEVDGFAFHHDVDRFRRDRQRQNALVAAGWTVLRFTWADLEERPDYVAAVVMAQLAAA